MLKDAKLRVHRMNVMWEDFANDFLVQKSDFTTNEAQILAKLVRYIKALEAIVTGEEGEDMSRWF